MSHPEHRHPGSVPAGHDYGLSAQNPAPDTRGRPTARPGHNASPGHDVHSGHDVSPGHGGRSGHDSHPGHGGGTEGGGHDGHAGHGAHGEMFRRRFWVSLILSLPVVGFSHMVAELLGYQLPDFPGVSWIPPVLGTVIFVYGGMPFLTGGWTELRSRRPGMMLLIAMAITVAFVASWVPRS